VRQLSQYVGVPRSILEKAPSADLWEDQTDEKELGFSYFEVDRFLYHLLDRRLTYQELLAKGFQADLIDQVVKRIKLNQYKRRMPLILKLSNRTVGVDFRYLRDWGL
jgi:NAD+ synthase